MSRLIDLSHTIEDGLITYKGLPAPVICDYLSREASKKIYAEGTTFQIGLIEMCSNTGTYLDSPFHRYENGKDISELNLESMASLVAVKVIVPENITAINEEYFRDINVLGKAVLVQTGWSRHWNTGQYYEGHPYLTEDAARFLKNNGAKLVGIDTYNIDDVSGKERPVHSVLLGSDILIVEHMCNLEAVPSSGFKFYAVPVKVKGFGTFPVRAFAEIAT
ncbi:MAG: cyclase family protein [Drouetiella hepatica Uher 2000/2452]|jgi:kynurenine formamidase|uniref:Cyclase family protein n=1 Tax=Drouetiella hepatica Uher 2000/2452 TaxID=904376 RepID=A0A951UMA2_9CYAN|nr:cyclase family protein [Drouetiella hepatica Uher 2000/2452]